MVDRTTVLLGDSYATRLPGTPGAVVEADTSVRCTVQNGGSTQVYAESTTTARLGTGEVIVVEVRVRLTPDGAHARGRVDVDRTTVPLGWLLWRV